MHIFRTKHELQPHGLRGPFVSLLLLLAAALGAGPAAQSQQDVGNILGTVTDQTGAAVPGAKITITWQSTGLSRTLVSDTTGYYTSEPLQVGQYTVTAEKSGFSTVTVHNLIVDAAAHVQANLILHVGETSANVTVQATPPVMDTTDAMVGNTIDTRDAQQLPVNGRSVLALATLSPGVESAVGAVSEGFQNRGTQVSAISIDGGPAGINENILDGVSNTQDWLGEIAINLKSDAVSEYHMVSGVIPAQFGYTSGGVVDVVSRSGSNAFHGSVYEFFRNDVLDAEVSFPRPPFGKQQTRFNNYGGALGGPLRHNKMFIFGNYEQYNYASNNPSYFTVPTAQEYTGNFSDLGQLVNGVCTQTKIYDDSNIVGGQRQQFDYNGIPNNIPTIRLDSVALAYEKLFYPMPNNTSGSYNSCTHANDYVYGFPVVSSERQGILRSDNKVSDKDNVMARYAYYFNATNFPFGSIPAGLPGKYDERNDDLQTQDGVLSETHVFSPSLLNDARIGLMLSDFPFQAGTAFQNVAGKIGLPNDTNISAPYMNNGIQTPNITVGFRSSQSLELFDDVTWVKRAHTLHIGGSVEWTEGYNNQTPSSASGQFNFIAGTTAEGNDTTVTTGTGNAFASYLLGEVNNATQVVIGGSAYRRMLYAGYVQDDWRVTPRLTINAGLRYDMQTQAVEKHNGIENFNVNEPNPTNSSFKGLVEYAGTSGYGRNFVAENFGDYGPRLGFAYSLDSKSATVLRGGIAIYYPSTAVYTYDQSSGNPLGYTSYTTTWTAATAEGIDFQLQNGFPTAYGVPLGVKGGENAFLGQSAAYIDPIAKDPSAQVFSATVSRQLPWNTVVDVSYAGNHGNHFENYSPNLNFLSPQYYSLGTAALSAQVTNPNAGLVPGSLGAATLTQAQLLKPFPYMSGVTMQNPRNGYYWSNQALLSVQRRVSNGLQMMGAYTFGKMTDAGVQNVANLSSVGMGTSASPQDPYNPRADHSLDTIDATHRLTISGLYDLPFGKGQRFANGGGATDRLVSGWQFNSIFTMQSGYPIGITGATNQGIATRPNWNPNVSPFVQHQGRSVLYKTGKLEWFNPQAFTDPADYSFGNVPREMGNMFGPGTVNIDMSVFKTTHITERTSFEFRIEAYNALNHPNLPMPGTAFAAGAPANPSNPYAEGGLNTSSTFGMITSGATTTRNVQLGAKIFF
jgi:hypothetical protein